MKIWNKVAIALLAIALETSVRGASIGDPAPALSIERWVKGAPSALTPGKNLYVVEFWATWCPPCRRSIPHLTELQKKYADKGLVIIGVSDETLADVQPFVAEQGGNMEYRVAIDSTRRTFQNWMKAYGQSGIPHSFIVGTNGTVWWHGFPSEELDYTLKKIYDGKFDVAEAKQKEAGERMVIQYTAMVKKPNATVQAAPIGDKILNEYSADWRIPHHLAKAIMTDLEVKSRDLPLALRATTKAVEMTKRRSSDALGLHGRALFANGKKDEGITALKEAIGLPNSAEDKAEFEKILAMLEKAKTMPAKTK